MTATDRSWFMALLKESGHPFGTYKPLSDEAGKAQPTKNQAAPPGCGPMKAIVTTVVCKLVYFSPN